MPMRWRVASARLCACTPTPITLMCYRTRLTNDHLGEILSLASEHSLTKRQAMIEYSFILAVMAIVFQAMTNSILYPATLPQQTIQIQCRVDGLAFLYLNPPYDFEVGKTDNQRMEVVFLRHTGRWVM